MTYIRESLLSSDELYELIDDTACMLRGMTLDPSIPDHAKEAMTRKVDLLEQALDRL